MPTPSGHALRSVVVFVVLAYVHPELRERRTVITGLVLLALIGVSRVYLGVHHPSDVLGGWFAGAALVAALSFADRDDRSIGPRLDEAHSQPDTLLGPEPATD